MINEKWVTDLTEFHIPTGKIYLSPMIDCFDGAVVSWTISTSPNAELVNTMLDHAMQTLQELTKQSFTRIVVRIIVGKVGLTGWSTMT